MDVVVTEKRARLYTKALALSSDRASSRLRADRRFSQERREARAIFPPTPGARSRSSGRSNSGKSTAINVVAGVRKLARVSKTPGRTQLFNFFALGQDRRLVDLPGYGFARVAPDVQERWRGLLEAYLREPPCRSRASWSRWISAAA